MSRSYEVQVEVFPCTAEERAHITDVLQSWGMEIDCDAESFDNEEHDGTSFWGSIQLAGGQTEEESHEALRLLLPDRWITSRWRWVDDDQPWDDVIETDPIKPAE